MRARGSIHAGKREAIPLQQRANPEVQKRCYEMQSQHWSALLGSIRISALDAGRDQDSGSVPLLRSSGFVVYASTQGER